MYAVYIDVNDQASPVVRAIANAVQTERIKPIIGRAAVNVFRSHLFAADSEKPNALGGTRTHFYLDAARGTHFDILPDGVMISVNQVGIRQRVEGGTIKPKTAKFLTIPARAEAHGKRASEFNDLVLVFGRGGVPIALARAGQTLLARHRNQGPGRSEGKTFTKRGEAGGEILFWLVTEVTQIGDPSVVPDAAELFAGINPEISSYINRAVARARGQSGGNN